MSFKQQEHATRHNQAAHSNKVFSCKLCHVVFNRYDCCFTFAYFNSTFLHPSFSKMRDHRLLRHSLMVNKSKMEQKKKSQRYVKMEETTDVGKEQAVEEVGKGIWDKSGQGQLVNKEETYTVVQELSVEEEGGKGIWDKSGVDDDDDFDETSPVVEDEGVDEGREVILDKRGQGKFEDLWLEDDEFEEEPFELLEGDYEGGWGEEDYDAKFDYHLRS